MNLGASWSSTLHLASVMRQIPSADKNPTRLVCFDQHTECNRVVPGSGYRHV